MNIAGFVKTSLVDYPGEIASVVFTQGCNWRCSYCHNSDLLEAGDRTAGILPEDILTFLAERQGLIDAVVISGGEPTLQEDLRDFIKDLKTLGLLVKLDTNGTNPDVLSKLFTEKLLDYVAMDLKAPLSKYQLITGTSRLQLSLVLESVKIIQSCGVAHEFRTTLCPELKADDILSLVNDFGIISNYVVQGCRGIKFKKICLSEQDRKRLAQWSQKGLHFSFRGLEAG